MGKFWDQFKKKITLLFISLWITQSAWAWGGLAHKLVVENGDALVDPKVFTNCKVTPAQLVEHTTDPDNIWKHQRYKYPHESTAHFFHVDEQPKDWKNREQASDLKKGHLVYRILEWTKLAKKLRADQKWDALTEKLYGLSHYAGDLSQPLHLHHDHDGVEAGLSGIHSQFETKMLNRYEEELKPLLKKEVSSKISRELWKNVALRDLVFKLAEESSAKTAALFAGAHKAFQIPKKSKKSKSKKEPRGRFVKAALWKNTGTLAVQQLAISANLWAHLLKEICQ